MPFRTDPNELIQWDTEPAQNTVFVTWQYKFSECRKFTVRLNGTPVQGCTNISDMNCTIRNLAAGVQYEIALIASEASAPSIQLSKLVTIPKNPETDSGPETDLGLETDSGQTKVLEQATGM